MGGLKLKELTEAEIEKAMTMFEGINAEGISYFLGFMAALISTARKNSQSHIDINQIEIAIESAKMQAEKDKYKFLTN